MSLIRDCADSNSAADAKWRRNFNQAWFSQILVDYSVDTFEADVTETRRTPFMEALHAATEAKVVNARVNSTARTTGTRDTTTLDSQKS